MLSNRAIFLSMILILSLFTATYVMIPKAEASMSYYVSPTGNDNNNGSLSSPWKTLQHACDKLKPGDVLYAKGGLYNEKICINVSGTPDGYITIQNFPGETPVIDGTGIEGSDMVLISGKSYIKLIGFEICNNTGDWITGININNGSNHIEVLNNKIHDINTNDASAGGANGIISYGDNANASNNNIKIDGNEIYNCVLGWSEALTINGNSEYWEVTNNKVHDVGNIGIDAAGHFGACPYAPKDQARNGVIKGNIVYNCNSPNEGGAAAGLYVDGGKDIVVERNIVHNTQHGLEIGCENIGKTTSGITVRDNIVYNNSKAGIMVGGWSSNQAGKVTNSKVLNNTCYNNDTENTGVGEFQISVVNGLTVKNNIFYSTGQGILLTNFFPSQYVANVVMNYNDWYSKSGINSAKFTWLNKTYTGFNAYKSGSGKDSNSIFANPSFTDETKFNMHLNPASPAINAGDPNFSPAVGETDFDGHARVSGGRVDCGAYEY